MTDRQKNLMLIATVALAVLLNIFYYMVIYPRVN